MSTPGELRSSSPTPSTGSVRGLSSRINEMIVSEKEVKIPLPAFFDGTRGNLKSFLLQVELYMRFHASKFKGGERKVLWVVTLLKGPAFDWIEPYVDDHMQNGANQKEKTKELIEDWAEFRSELENMFGDIDAEHLAERSLRALRQKGSTSHYAADFRRFSSRVTWGDSALKSQFYEGLKESVKDEIARDERPDNLDDLIELATRIDNRMYEQQLERTKGF